MQRPIHNGWGVVVGGAGLVLNYEIVGEAEVHD